MLLEVDDTPTSTANMERVEAALLQPGIPLTVPLEIEVSRGQRWGQYDTVYTRSTT